MAQGNKDLIHPDWINPQSLQGLLEYYITREGHIIVVPDPLRKAKTLNRWSFSI